MSSDPRPHRLASLSRLHNLQSGLDRKYDDGRRPGQSSAGLEARLRPCLYHTSNRTQLSASTPDSERYLSSSLIAYSSPITHGPAGMDLGGSSSVESNAYLPL